MLDSAELMRYIRIFSELSSQVRYSTQKRILIEIAVIKLCRPQMEEDVSSILARLTQLEKKLEGGVVQPAVVMPETTADLPKAPLPKAISEDIRQVVENWRSIVSQMPHSIRVFIQKAHLSIGENDVLMIVLDDSILCDMLSEEERLKEITDTISKCIGKQIQIQIKYNHTGQSFEQSFVET